MIGRENLEDQIREFLFSSKDKYLTLALTGITISRENEELLFDDLIIDKESTMFLLSLAVIGYKNGWEKFPHSIVPRLMGIHRYFQAQNTMVSPWLKKQLEILSINHIPFILSGGTALRAFYNSNTPRVMDAYDIVVPSNLYKDTIENLRNEVRQAKGQVKGDTVSELAYIRIKEGVPDKRVFDEKGFWDRSFAYRYLEQDCKISSREDLILQLLCLPYGPWIVNEKRAERTRRLSEVLRLLSNAEPDILEKIAVNAGLKEIVTFYFRLFAKWTPETIDFNKWQTFLSVTKSYQRFCRKLWRVCKINIQLEEKTDSINRIRLRLAIWNMIQYLKLRKYKKHSKEENETY